MMNYFQKKKLAFMSIVNRVKGFIRTITGALPLTLEGCVDEESIIDYTLYGQSVQDGTPTPEMPVEVESVGEKTKNLFDIDNAMVSVDNWHYIGGSYSYGLNLEVGKQYRFSCDVINNPGVFIADICRKPKIADWSYSTLYRLVGQSSTTGKKSYTFVADGTECLWLYHSGGGSLNLYKKYITENIKNIQLEEGTTATDYEPYGYKIPIKVSSNGKTVTTNIYLDEPLRKVGTKADYVDSESDKVVKKVKEIKFDGTEGWYVNGNKDGLIRFYLGGVVPMGTAGQVAALSNFALRTTVYGADWWKQNTFNTYAFVAQKGWIGFCVSAEDFPTVEYFKSFLATKYSEGNPLKVYFVEPTETPITLPILPTFKGTSIISADTTIQPSNAEIEYYSNVKE